MRINKVPTQVTLAKGNIITIIMVINAIITATKVTVKVINEVDSLVMDSKDVTYIGNGITQMRDLNMGEGFTKIMVIAITGSETMGTKDIMVINARIQS